MKHLRKGDYIQVTGSLKFEKWDDRDTGKPRSKHVLNAHAFWTVADPPGATAAGHA
jgi:single-stranded DNA-binding protein